MYNRNAQVRNPSPAQNLASQPDGPTAANNDENKVRINGFQQVLEMLRVADPQFRESLLRRMANTDPRMAKMLRAQLAND